GTVWMKPETWPHRLRIGRGGGQRARVRLGIDPDADHAPHVMREGDAQGIAEVREGRVVQVTVRVDHHPGPLSSWILSVASDDHSADEKRGRYRAVPHREVVS